MIGILHESSVEGERTGDSRGRGSRDGVAWRRGLNKERAGFLLLESCFV